MIKAKKVLKMVLKLIKIDFKQELFIFRKNSKIPR